MRCGDLLPHCLRAGPDHKEPEPRRRCASHPLGLHLWETTSSAQTLLGELHGSLPDLRLTGRVPTVAEVSQTKADSKLPRSWTSQPDRGCRCRDTTRFPYRHL